MREKYQELDGEGAAEVKGYQLRLNQLDQELANTTTQLQIKEENMRNLQAVIDQYADKCGFLEQELSHKIQEIEALKQDLEKYEIDQLAGSAGE